MALTTPHSGQTIAQGRHALPRAIFADDAARIAYPATTEDLHAEFYQTDFDIYWRCSGLGPVTWKNITPADDDHGEMKEVSLGAGTAIALADKTLWYPWISGAAGINKGRFSFVADAILGDGLLLGPGPDVDVDVEMVSSFAGSANTRFWVAVFLDAALTDVVFVRHIGAGGDAGSGAAHGHLLMSAGETLRLKFRAPLANTKSVSVEVANVTCHPI